MNSVGIRRILKNSAYLYMTLLMSQGLRFVYIFVIARLLGAEMYGLLAFGNAWYMMFLPMTGLGLGIYLSQKVGRNPTKAGFRTVPLVASIRFAAVTLVAGICLSIGLLNADTETVSAIIVIYTVALVGRAMVLWSTQMFQAYEQTVYVFRLERIFKPAEVMIGLVVAFMTENVLLVACVHAVGMICQGILAVAWVNRHLVKVNLTWRPKMMLAIVIKLLPLGVAVVLGQFLFQGPVVLLKQENITFSQIGNFSLAVQLFVVFLSIFASLKTAALPALSRNALHSLNKLRDYSRYSIVLAVVFGCFCATFASYFAEPLIVFLFTEKFRMAGQAFSLLIWALVPAIIQNMLNSTQAALEHNKSVLVINAVGAIILVGGMIYFTQLNIIEGAAFAVIAGFTGSALTSVLYLIHKQMLSFASGLLLPIVIVACAIAAMHYLPTYLSDVLSVAISSALILLMSWALLLHSQERRAIIEKVFGRK